MRHIFNLTQHPATSSQIEAGVFDPSPELREKISALLTFDDIPSNKEMIERARALLELAPPFCFDVMVGGAPYFMPYLESVLRYGGLDVHYAFSRRESVEEVQPDGTVRKVAVFRHLGFKSQPAIVERDNDDDPF